MGIFKKKKKEDSKLDTTPNNIYKEDVTLEECDSKKEKEEMKQSSDHYRGIFPDPEKIETLMSASIRLKKAVQHVVLDMNWSAIFDEKLVPNVMKWKFDPNAKKEVVKGLDAWTVEILSTSECAKLIELCEMYGFEDCGYPKSYRGNTRIITSDNKMVEKLYERIKECCPQRYKSDGAMWEICGLNERLRWCKYIKGQRFGTHCDARFCRSFTEKSFYTVNIYLNDGKSDFGGGRTRFFGPNKKNGKWKEIGSVTASPGLALMFNQHPDRIEHDGEVLTKGTKYLMRTDVMYKKTEIELDPKTKWQHGPYYE